jgi:hypothetical protein
MEYNERGRNRPGTKHETNKLNCWLRGEREKSFLGVKH